MSRSSRLRVGVVALSAGQVGGIASSALTSIVFAHLLGVTGTGKFALTSSLLAVATLLFGLGLATGLNFVVSGGGWRLSDAQRQSERSALVLGVAGVLATLVIYVALATSVFRGISVSMLLPVLLSLPFALALSFSSAIVLAREQYATYGALQLVRAFLGACLAVALAFEFGLVGAVVGLASAVAMSAALARLLVMKKGKQIEGAGPRPGEAGRTAKQDLRSAYRFGRRAWAADILQLLNYRLDLFLLNAFAASADVGRYSVAVAITGLSWIVPNALNSIVFTRTAQQTGATRSGAPADERDDAVSRTVRHTIILLVPTAVGVSALLVVAVPLVYGAAFKPSAALGLLLLPGVLALAVAKVLSAVTSGRGRPVYSLYNAAVTAPVTIAMYLILIPAYGARGAAVASSVSYIASAGIALFFFQRLTHISVRSTVIPRRSDLRDYASAMRRLRSRLARPD